MLSKWKNTGKDITLTNKYVLSERTRANLAYIFISYSFSSHWVNVFIPHHKENIPKKKESNAVAMADNRIYEDRIHK